MENSNVSSECILPKATEHFVACSLFRATGHAFSNRISSQQTMPRNSQSHSSIEPNHLNAAVKAAKQTQVFRKPWAMRRPAVNKSNTTGLKCLVDFFLLDGYETLKLGSLNDLSLSDTEQPATDGDDSPKTLPNHKISNHCRAYKRGILLTCLKQCCVFALETLLVRLRVQTSVNWLQPGARFAETILVGFLWCTKQAQILRTRMPRTEPEISWFQTLHRSWSFSSFIFSLRNITDMGSLMSPWSGTTERHLRLRLHMFCDGQSVIGTNAFCQILHDICS